MAVNCCVSPLGIDELAGVTAIDTSAGVVTVSAAGGLLIEPNDAMMFVEPSVSVAANPELLIVATAVSEEVQVTELVRFAVLELE